MNSRGLAQRAYLRFKVYKEIKICKDLTLQHPNCQILTDLNPFPNSFRTNRSTDRFTRYTILGFFQKLLNFDTATLNDFTPYIRNYIRE